MPYTNNADLPGAIKNNLPEHAQTMWREAFNSAEQEYPEKEQAYKVAWSAVKNVYEKDSKGNWVKKD